MKFTHDYVDDTVIENTGDGIRYVFHGESGDEEYTFKYNQVELLLMLSDYFDLGKHADLFDDLTLNAQDALFNALLWLHERKVWLPEVV